jgi:hypothetical protein
MAYYYSDPARADMPNTLPDVEVFYHTQNSPIALDDETGESLPTGWYWWSCFPGCLPDGEPTGPYPTEAEALADAQYD